MHKKMTITLDEAIYYGLYQIVGKRKISQFIENLVKPYVSDSSLDVGYKAMAADADREKEAAEWCNALVGDIDESR